MSKEAIQQLFQDANEDVALQHRLENASGYAEAVHIGAENGYDFTEEEARVFLAEHGLMSDGPEGELSEEALEAVAGGWFDNWRVRVSW